MTSLVGQPMADWLTMVDEAGLRRRLRLTALAGLHVLLGVAGLALAILTPLAVALAPIGVGLLLAHGVVPASEALARVERRLAGEVLDSEVPAPTYAESGRRGALLRPFDWVRDPARWRDFAGMAFAGTGGLALTVLLLGFLVNPTVSLVGLLVAPSWTWFAMLGLLGPVLVTAWWILTPVLARARALAVRGILGRARTEELERRVQEVTASRAESLDHSAAELRRIERDLHDGAQARLTSIGMTVGFAESMLQSDPEQAAQLLQEARESTVTALEELRSLVRGIHPPVLADLGLVPAVENLAMALPVPVDVEGALDGHPPAPVESATYFAVAECLANLVKHAQASRARVRVGHDGARLHCVVEDDGIGGADPTSSGLDGVRRRLAALDGTMSVDSPAGGPTIVTMELPCVLSSQRTKPSSGTA